MVQQPFRNRYHLFRGLPFGENHFRHPVTERAMMVDFGETQVLKGKVAQPGHCAVDIYLSPADLFDKQPELILVHEARISNHRGTAVLGLNFGKDY
jgi:hypothetical protein